ncbi:hypothetical protein Hdeb2414_s0012g00387331 [Helianthus debilis subsp. tardiflorus]
MPEDLGDENFALYASNDSSHNEFCLMALESIQEGVETEEEQLNIETVEEVTEAVVTAVAGELLLGKSSGTLIEPLTDPWSEENKEEKKEEKAGEKEERAEVEEHPQCDCAMMAAAKVLDDDEDCESDAQEEVEDPWFWSDREFVCCLLVICLLVVCLFG